MSALNAIDESPLLRRYYSILTGGIDAYEGTTDLLPLLAENFTFDGPISGRIAGGVRFTHGIRGFIETVRNITLLQALVTPAGAAVLYDASLPNGTVRFSEFFEFEGDKIRALRIQYPAADYIAGGGR